MTSMNLIDLWNSAWPAAAVMLGLGGLFALVLLIASVKLRVEVDPKIAAVTEALPGLDCGGCGFAGCGAYAKAVISEPDLLGKCAPGGAKCTAKIAEILNLAISESGPPKRPIVHCRAHENEKTQLARYEGVPTCLAANALTNAQACRFGCLGFGDCVNVCRFDAIHVVDGLATVDYEKCTGCGACEKACPRDIIEMAPFGCENMMTVACSNIEIGKVTRKMCTVGCIGCGLCAKQTDIFKIENNLAKMNYTQYEPNEQTETAYTKCPTKVIVYRGKNAPPDQESKKK